MAPISMRVFLVGFLACLSLPIRLYLPAQAADNANDRGGADTADPNSLKQSIDAEQRLLANQFTKLEELFIRLAELEGSANPSRANLLQQAAQLSKQLATQQRLSIAVDYLAKGQYTRALQEQEAARDNLRKLLELLQRENRNERVKNERERIENLIKEVQRVGRLQKSLRGRTESGQEFSESEQEQQSLEKQADELAKSLIEINGEKAEDASEQTDAPNKDDGKESPNGKPTDGEEKPSDAKNASKPTESDDKQSSGESKENSQPADSNSPDKPSKETSETKDEMKEGSEPKSEKSSESKPTDSKQGTESKPNEQGSKSENPSEPSPSQQGQPQQGQPQQGQPQQGQPQQGQPQQGQPQQGQPQQNKEQNDAPKSQEQRAQERVQRAQERMRQAMEKLEEKQRSDAVEEQQAAEKELAAAVEELESILRQMREEEIERSLANLESRFRRMLTMQSDVLTQTEKYASVDSGLDERQIELQSVKLAIEERKILIEGQRAMLLLEDEGSSMAFPEAVEQLNGDIAMVTEMFNRNRLDTGNVQLQQQIVSTLEELLESLTATQKERDKKKEEKKNAQQGQSGGSSQEQQLVDKLAELRLIRTLQMRINKRTNWLAEQNGDQDDLLGQVVDPLLTQQAKELAERQDRLESVLRDIILQAGRDK